MFVEQPGALGYTPLAPRAPEAVIAILDCTSRLHTSRSSPTGPALLPRETQAKLRSSPWCESAAKRYFDFFSASFVLITLLPTLVLIAAAIRLTSAGPAIFRQKRVGKHGVMFTIFKFRTMKHAVEGSRRSSHSDRRTTRIGRILRKYKLDELPQLLNVCLGDMSLVGPRPKLHGHHSADICFRPGLTGAATIAFCCEERLLRSVSPEQLEEYHRLHITPRKLELDMQYMARATFSSDLGLLWKTLRGTGRYQHLGQLPCSPEPPVPEACESYDICRPALLATRGKRDLPYRRDTHRLARRGRR